MATLDPVPILAAAKRIVAIVGAGISTNLGIPDFRSASGLYSLSDFHRSTLGDPASGARLLKALAQIRSLAMASEITETHAFIRSLRDKGRLLRLYSQNIDDKDEQSGLLPWVDFVPLHGSLKDLHCKVCSYSESFDGSSSKTLESGTLPPCPSCLTSRHSKAGRPLKPVTSTFMLPNIVLGGEADPNEDLKGDIIYRDLSSQPDLLLIMGTSLQCWGACRLAIAFATKILESSGHIFVVNKTPMPKSVHFAYTLFQMDCDAWVNRLNYEVVLPTIQKIARAARPRRKSDFCASKVEKAKAKKLHGRRAVG